MKKYIVALLCFLFNWAVFAECPNGYYDNVLDLSTLDYISNGIWYASVGTYTSSSYLSQGLSTRCEGYDINLSGNWFGTDEGDSCIDCRFDNMSHGDWYIEFDKDVNGFSNFRGTSACISTSYASGIGFTGTSESVNPAHGERTGSSCWCKLLSVDEIDVNSKWVYDGSNNYWSQKTCIQECAKVCASDIRTTAKLRQAMIDYTDQKTITGCSALNQDIYNISYDLSGGTNYDNAPFCYKITSGDIVFGTPAKSGDVFINWVDINDNVVKSIPAGSMQDISVVALWQSDLSCPAGQYMHETNCINVGNGFYSPDAAIVRYECPSGLTTIGYGAGADEVGDCGHILHVDDKKIYLRTDKKTEHALHIKLNNQIFYGSMTTQKIGPLHILYDGVKYTVYDDSMME